MQNSRRQFLAVVTAGVATGLAGCSGDGATPTETSTETPTETSTETPTETSTETPTETPTATEAPTATETATPTVDADQQVTVAPDGELRFEPETFEISAGDTVLWEWDAGLHNIKTESVPSGSDWTGTAGSDTFGSGHTYSYTFETPGEYEYYCNPHESFMRGTFTVTE